jgi:hypothetical protein
MFYCIVSKYMYIVGCGYVKSILFQCVVSANSTLQLNGSFNIITIATVIVLFHKAQNPLTTVNNDQPTNHPSSPDCKTSGRGLTQRTVLKTTYILVYVLYKNFIVKVCILRYWQRHIFR